MKAKIQHYLTISAEEIKDFLLKIAQEKYPNYNLSTVEFKFSTMLDSVDEEDACIKLASAVVSGEEV